MLMSTGWFRLWVVASCILLIATASASAYYVWGKDACYTFVSVSIADNVRSDDLRLAEAIRKEATERTFCGTAQLSPLLTLEDLAKRGVVTQVGVSWLEPSGWSVNDLGTLERQDVKAAEIISRASGYVHSARLSNAIWFLAVAAAISVAMLALGIAARWAHRGFRSGSA
jgi:hypothetical protein